MRREFAPAASAVPTRIPFRLPVAAFVLAHVAALAAFAALALDPGPFLATHLHPRVLRAVHALTLGWITLTAVGATWVVGHLALRMHLAARRTDGVALGFLTVGALGVAFHMGDGLWRGVGWSGLMSLLALAWLAGRVLWGLLRAASPLPIRLHVAAAYGNLLLASALGAAIAFALLPPHLPHTVALVLHAHVAVVGFAITLAVGVGYRLLPMILPAAPPPAGIMWTSLVALELGIVAVLGRVVADVPAVALFGGVCLGLGLAAFLVGVVYMLAHRRPPPRDLRRPDPAACLVVQAVVCLAAAVALGLWLDFQPEPAAGPRAFAYGALALVGFLGQLIAGVGFRMLPWLAWRHVFAVSAPASAPASATNAGDTGPSVAAPAFILPTPPNAMGSPPARWLAVAGWAVGVGCLVTGLLLERSALVRTAGIALATAVLAGLLQLVAVLLGARGASPAGSGPLADGSEGA